MSYRVELPVFSGPMDLLLHLVRKAEVDIHEVRIAKVLDDYLRHLQVLQQLDLHDIGDFVVMASTLMEIKSKELLPNESIEIEEEFDPLDDLIRRLLEYKRYRDLARELDTRSERRSRQSSLVMAQPPAMSQQPEEDLLDLGELGVWDLTSAFAKLLEEIGQQQSLEVEVEKRDVGHYTRVLLDTFRKTREVRFSEVFDRREGRYGMIGTLIALLEMMKQGYLRAFQENCFDDISLAFTGDDSVSADQILAGISAEELSGELDAGQGDDGELEAAFRASGEGSSGDVGDTDDDEDELLDPDGDDEDADDEWADESEASGDEST